MSEEKRMFNRSSDLTPDRKEFQPELLYSSLARKYQPSGDDNQFKVSQSYVDYFQSQSIQQEKLINNLHNELVSNKSYQRQLELKIQDLQYENTKQSELLTKYRQENDLLQAQLDKTLNNLLITQVQLKEQTESNHKLNAANMNLDDRKQEMERLKNSEINILKLELEKAHQTIDGLRDNLNQTKNERDQYQQDLYRSDKERNAKNVECEQLKQKQDVLFQKQSEVTGDNSRLLSDLESCRQELQMRTFQLEKLEKDYQNKENECQFNRSKIEETERKRQKDVMSSEQEYNILRKQYTEEMQFLKIELEKSEREKFEKQRESLFYQQEVQKTQKQMDLEISMREYKHSQEQESLRRTISSALSQEKSELEKQLSIKRAEIEMHRQSNRYL